MIKRIIADCSVDTFAIDGVDFKSLPLTISTDERTFLDDENLDVSKMLDYLASHHGRSYTACPGLESWLEAYDGADEIFVVTLSSNLSGTYNAAKMAGEMYIEEHENAKVHVVDSLSAGTEVRMIADKIAELIKAGLDYEEICRKADEYVKHTRIFFALESFHNFAENGRVSKVVAAAAGLLGIRIMATGSKEGTIDTVAKCRGEAGTIKAFVENLKKAGFNGKNIYIAQCFCPEFAEKVKNAILKVYPETSFRIYPTHGLCSFYAEKGGLLLGFEVTEPYK